MGNQNKLMSSRLRTIWGRRGGGTNGVAQREFGPEGEWGGGRKSGKVSKTGGISAAEPAQISPRFRDFQSNRNFNVWKYVLLDLLEFPGSIFTDLSLKYTWISTGSIFTDLDLKYSWISAGSLFIDLILKYTWISGQYIY